MLTNSKDAIHAFRRRRTFPPVGFGCFSNPERIAQACRCHECALRADEEWVERLMGALSSSDLTRVTEQLRHVEKVVEEDSRQFQLKRQSEDSIARTRKGK